MSTANNHIDALLFDLDGTLIDTAADFIYVLNRQRVKYGFSTLNELSIRNTVSDGARALTKLAFGGQEGEKLFEQHRQALLDEYMDVVGDHAKLFDGMHDVLSSCEMKKIPWGIITNKPRRFTELLLQKLNLDSRCSVLLCADDVTHPKPHPESMYIASKNLNTQPEKMVYVGDHERDISAGNAANMTTVAAGYGYINDKTNIPDWQANFIIHHPSELKQLFLS